MTLRNETAEKETPPSHNGVVTPSPALDIPVAIAPVAEPGLVPGTLRRAPREEYLPYSPPLLGEEEIGEVVATLRSDWLSTGPRTRAFEADFARHVGAPAALALNSCTAALHTALRVHGIGAGDEVITTPMTFAATANVIEHVGARPVFVDVEPDTLNIDPTRVEAALTPRTRAVIAVHYAGHPAELDALRSLCDTRGIVLVEDAAHAVPARYRGRMIGSGDNPVAFSFYATKNMTTGEGGMLTGDPGFLAQARVVSLHGMSRGAHARYQKGGSWYYEVEMPGFKYNMTDIQAAIGIWQLRKLARFQARRAEIVQMYQHAFSLVDAIERPVERAHVEHAWHLYVVRLRPDALRVDRARFIELLGERNIGTSVHFIPVHLHPYYRDRYGFTPADFPVALDHYERCISLPLNPRMSDGDVADVVQAVYEVAAEWRR